MAGGKGTRLRPFTNSIPKALVEVNGTPIIDRIIAQFRTWGCEGFWATVDYHAEKLEEHLDNVNPGRRVRLVNTDGHWGTAAPLKVLQVLVDPPFVLSNCDVLVDADYPTIARNIDQSFMVWAESTVLRPPIRRPQPKASATRPCSDSSPLKLRHR